MIDQRYMVLSTNPGRGLNNYLQRLREIGGIDINIVYRVAVETSNLRRKIPSPLAEELEKKWYSSLSSGSPDWDIYNTDYYLGELWACWKIYSRRYLIALLNDRILPGQDNIQKVLDLGCGFGYTTAALKQIFPEAQVVGTNIEGAKQTKVARILGEEFGFTVISNFHDITPPIDIIFASEYFEHIPEPLLHLSEIIARLRPKKLFIANTFGQRAIGHFNTYKYGEKDIPGKEMSRLFNNQLRDSGYIKAKTNLWNNRPAVWIING